MGLPDEFIASAPGSMGGGVIQVSITDIIHKPFNCIRTYILN